MPWNTGVFTATNGVFTGTGIWAKDAAAGTKITAAHHDTHDDDLAAGINACVAKDGSNVLTILNLSGTVNSASGIIKVGTLVLASTFGTNNAFFGGAGNLSLTATNCSGFGYQALLQLTSGVSNTAVGGLALPACTTGANNSGFGVNALPNVTTGNRNTAVGSTSGVTLTTGSNNIVVGYNCDVPSASADGQMSIGNAIYGTGNTGTSSTPSTGNIGLFTTDPTARLHLPAGTATASTAPLKLTSGTLLGTPETGAIEFDGTHLYITIGGVRKTVTVT